MIVYLRRSRRTKYKYEIEVDGRTIHFGAVGYSDFTKHKDPDRKRSYIARHGSRRSRQKWGKNGIKTAGFWSRWLLWNKPTLAASIRDTERRFGITIRRRR